jgi:hypothetical protein
MDLHDLAGPPVRLRLRGRADELTEKLALRAALTAAHLFGLATGILLRRLRERNDPLAEALARAKEAELKAACFLTAAQTIGARFDRLPDRKRPFYRPRQRFQILELKNLLGLSADQVASLFRVCPHTILNWERNVDPDQKTVGKTVRPTPPITRFAEVVRHTVQMMGRFGSDETAARILTRAGWRVSERSVRRVRSEKPRQVPSPRPGSEPHRTTHPVIARFVNHTWMMDVTEIRAFLGAGTLYLATVFDAFSRVPLVVQGYQGKPGASAMAKLLKTALRAFGKAKYVITDQPLNLTDLEARVELALAYYLCFRPHQGLSGATPAEAFLGVDPACTKAVAPPRGRPGEGPRRPPFEVGFLDPEKRAFPILKHAA